jgi:hypothetical protein
MDYALDFDSSQKGSIPFVLFRNCGIVFLNALDSSGSSEALYSSEILQIRDAGKDRNLHPAPSFTDRWPNVRHSALNGNGEGQTPSRSTRFLCKRGRAAMHPAFNR